MTVLPIVARELRVASRRRGTYWVRTGAALAVIILGTWFFLMMQREAPHEIGQVLFGILTGSAVLYCLLSGVRSTADCLSEEKREGTLGLLFLTDLKGYDVVLGKLAANSLNSLYSVLAVVPMLAVPLLMGGVTLGEFGRMAILAVNTLFFSLAAGMCISSMSRSGRKAVALTFVLIMVPTALLPACGAWLAEIAKTRSPDVAFLLPSVGYTFYLAFDTPFKTGADKFWTSLLLLHGAAWVLLILASLIAPRSWKDKPASIQRLRWRERWQVWSYGSLAQRIAFRKRLLDANAFFWLAARARLKPAQVWTMLGLLGCGWIWGWLKFHRDWLNEFMYIATGLALNLLIKAWFTAEVGRQLAEDRKLGALELLLSTPLTVRDILRGQLLALMRQFLGPVVVVLVIGCVFMSATISDTTVESDRAPWLWFWGQGMIMLVADLAAIFWVGMWQGLVAKNPNRAASSTLARVIIFPSIVYAFLMLVMALVSMRGGSELTWRFYIGCWFGLGLATDIVFGLRARQKLLSQFRVAAAHRYIPGAGFWKRLLAGGAVPAPGK
jgi:ABC-type Na+ efflux pump permease subunit